MNNILITGGNGFLGSNFLNYMVNKYPNINFYNYDCNYYSSSKKNTELLNHKDNYKFFDKKLQDKDFLLNFLYKNNIDIIIHFAGQTNIDDSFYNSSIYIEDNINATYTLLECINIYNKINRFIYISSDEVYGENLNNDIKTEETLLSPTNLYGASKASVEMLLKSSYYSYNLPIIIVRCNNIYGKNQYIEKVIPKFIIQIISNKYITIQGDGNIKRSFLYINDFINGLEIILNNGLVGNIYNIGSNDEISIIDLAKKLLHLIKGYDYLYINNNLHKHIYYIKDRKYNKKNCSISYDKIKSLGWEKKYSFDEGLLETINWYINNFNYWD